MNKELIAEIADELRDLQAVCERLGVDDDGVLHGAADRIEELEVKLEAVRGLPDKWRKSNYHNHLMPEYVCANELEAALKESGDG